MSRVREQYERACNYLAGGVSSSTRVNQAIGHALLFDRADGCRVWDLDGREYIDLCCSHGATLLGHGDARVRAAVDQALARGAACSYESELHGELARLLCETVPCLERLRFTGSGTEATMHCIRLARAYTGRTKLLRFEGNFHGYHDQVMFGAAGALGAVEPRLAPQSAGVTPGLGDHLIQVPYNHPELLNDVFERHSTEIAAVMLEPVYYNAGCVLPRPGFLEKVRELCRANGALLMFDEVLSAFRMCAGGAQQYLGVTPDLCTLGKAVGGGYPLSVFGGRREIMDRLMPIGDCQHSGTYNAHPVSVAASYAAVTAYREADFYPHIHEIADRLYSGMNAIFDQFGVTARVRGLGARFGVYFWNPGDEPDGDVQDYAQVHLHDRARMLRFIAAAIEHGVYFHDYGGGACHHGFCAATTDSDVDDVLDRLTDAVRQMSAAE